MIRECSRNKLDIRLSECARNVLGIPTHVNCNLAHRIAWREGFGVLVNHSFESKVTADLRGGAEPIVTCLVGWIRGVTKVEIGASIQSLSFGSQRLIY